MKISDKEQAILANLYDSPTYTVFKKHFLSNRQMVLAQEAVNMRTIEGVTELRGRILELKEIDSKLEKIYRKQETKK